MSEGGAFDKRSGPLKTKHNVAGQLTNTAGTRPVGKYLTGARIILRINSKLVGFAFGITWKIDTQQMEVNTIDDYLPAEIAPTRIHISGTINALHIPGQSPTKEEYQSNILSFLAHQYITIEARDSQTDELLFYTAKAVITSRQEDLQAGQLAKMTLQFMAIGWQDELQPSIPKGVNVEKTGDSAGSSTVPTFNLA